MMPEIPEGAVRVHLYNFEDVLRPRGHMKKESLGEHILECLTAYHESWTDKKYGDNPEEFTLLQKLYDNLMSEVHGAHDEFIQQLIAKKKEKLRLLKPE